MKHKMAQASLDNLKKGEVTRFTRENAKEYGRRAKLASRQFSFDQFPPTTRSYVMSRI